MLESGAGNSKPRRGWWQQKVESSTRNEPPRDPDPRDISAARERVSRNKRTQNAYSKARFITSETGLPITPPTFSKVNDATGESPQRRTMRNKEERDRALAALAVESQRPVDRIFGTHGERVRRMRSSDSRRGEKKDAAQESNIDMAERIRRVNILLRAGAYDRNRLSALPSEIPVRMTRSRQPDDVNPITTEEHIVRISKSEINTWINDLTPYERQRLYVIGRKKIDFKLRRENYKEMTDEEFEAECVFQADQKRLADALEVVAVPMIQAVFKSLNKKVNVYLTSSNDDIAGGLDIAIELKKANGQPHLFFDKTPMRFVVDVTYARMRDKASIDLARGRICPEAYAILKGRQDTVPSNLSNARAMKLFRTIVETLGGNMSTQTFNQHGPLKKPQEHVPRLIIGLDWDKAFTAIADWVEEGDRFEDSFMDSELARRMTLSIGNQLKGLHALASQDAENPNSRYLAQILRTMDFKVDEKLTIADDKSLANIDRLLTLDTTPLNKWQRDRIYRAALAQVEHDKKHQGHVRGDAEADNEAQDETSVVPTVPKYINGISMSKYAESSVIEKAPSPRTERLMEEIYTEWKRASLDAMGNRKVSSKKGAKATYWGDWLAAKLDTMGRWSDKEHAYIRSNLPADKKKETRPVLSGTPSEEPVAVPREPLVLTTIPPSPTQASEPTPVLKLTEAERRQKIATLEAELVVLHKLRDLHDERARLKSV